MSQKSLTEVATNRLVIVFSECSTGAQPWGYPQEEVVRWRCKRWRLCDYYVPRIC